LAEGVANRGDEQRPEGDALPEFHGSGREMSADAAMRL
jgi:hypothetical protein